MSLRTRNKASRMVAALLCFATVPSLSAEAPKAETPKLSSPRVVDSVLYNGETLTFRVERARRKPDFIFAGWNFGTKFTGDRARDKHGNLYLIVPGTDHVIDGLEEFAHNRLISFVPERERATQWDVYWAVVLDPAVKGDFRSERELIVAAQGTFDPSNVSFDELPSASVLKHFLRVSSFEDLDHLRTKDGQLPSVIIVSAAFSLRGTVIEKDPPSFARQEVNRPISAAPLKRD